jgi:hypothetical protein
MLVVQFSRMQAPEPKLGDACVLWRRWRLVEDRELFDLATDPSQKQNVLEQNPDVVSKMRGHYSTWWSRIADRVNEHAALTIGSDSENPMQLSPADWEDSFLDQGKQVRDGLRRNGAWNVLVDKEGEYEIELRRWAREADAPFPAPLPRTKHTDGEFTAGVALPVAKVRLKVADFDSQRDVAETDRSATFTVSLPVGRTKLQTWLLDADGRELAGAYYVYVRRK